MSKKRVSFIALALVICFFSSFVYADDSTDNSNQVFGPIRNILTAQSDDAVSSFADSSSPVPLTTAKKVGNWIYVNKSTYNYGLSRIEKKKGSKPVAFTDSTTSFQTSGQWIIYKNLSDNNKLYRVKNDGSGKKKITDIDLSGFQVSGDWIIYVDRKSDNSLKRMKIDGTGNQAISGIKGVGEFRIFGDLIVYENSKDKSKPYIVKVNGTWNKKLADQSIYPRSLNYSNGYFYYTDYNNKGSLTKIKADGTAKAAVVLNERIGNYTVSNGWVYYVSKTKNYSLFKIKTDGKENKIISNTPASYFILSGNYIYSKDLEGDGITKVKQDGTGKLKVANYKGYELNVAGDTLYLRDDDSDSYYKIKADGKAKKEPSTMEEYILATDVTNNKWVWYWDNHEEQLLYKTNAVTNEKKLLANGRNFNYLLYANTIYYQNNTAILSMKDDGTNSKKLYSGNYPYIIKIEKDFIYFRDSSQGSFCRIKTDGSQLKSFKTDSEQITGIINGNVYYPEYGDNGYSMNRLNMDTGVNDKIVDGVGNRRIINNGKLYYIMKDSNALFCNSLDGSEVKTVLDNETDSVFIDNDWVYYNNLSDQGFLYKVKYDGSEKTKILDENINIVGIKSDWIIYTDESEGYFKVKTDGTEASPLVNDKITHPQFDGNTIYFTMTNKEGLYTTVIGGTGQPKLLNSKINSNSYYYIACDYIYYISGEYYSMELYRIKFGSTKPEKL